MITDIFKKYSIFILFSFVLFTLMLIIENYNGKFDTDDFKVFYMAAKALTSNNQVYGVPFGLSTGFYKYSPFTLLLFSFYTLFSFKIGAIIHYFISATSAILSIITIEQIINKYILINNKWSIVSSFLILLSVLLHFIRDLHLGNTNIILIFALILSIKMVLESKEILAGLIIALVILTKPYFIVLALILLVYKKYKTVASITVSGIVLTLSTAVILGFSKSYNLHIEWFEAMLAHSSYLSSPYTVFYLINYYFGIEIPQVFSFVFFGIVILLISLFFYLKSKKETAIENNKSLIFAFFITIAIIPNLLITDVEHFLFSLPLIAIVILYIRNLKNYIFASIFTLIIIMYGGNSSDIVGNELSIDIKYWGFVGIGNLLIIASAFLIYQYGNRKKGIS